VRAPELIEEALTTSHAIQTFVLEDDGSIGFRSWPDQWVRTEEHGLFRALVAEMRLVDGVIPEPNEMMARARQRLAGVASS